MREFLDDTRSPSDGSVVSKELYYNTSNRGDVKMAAGAPFKIPEGLWPMIQGRKIIYKDFNELGSLKQQELLGVCYD